jgi:signal transduction histidine kinase
MLARVGWWPLAALAAGVFILSLPAYILNLGKGPPDVVAGIGSSSGFVFVIDVLSGLASVGVALISFGLAILLFRRKPGEEMALFASFYLLVFGVLLAGPLEELEAFWPGTYQLAMKAEALVMPAWSVWLLFLFPSGRFVPAWTRWLALACIPLAPLALLVLPARGSLESPGPVTQFGAAIWAAFGLLGVYAQIYRYRRASDPLQRQQTKWVVLGLTAWIVVLTLVTVLWFLRQLIPPGEPIPWWASVSELVWFLSLSLLPATLTVAVMRYHLWDVDLIINRTLVYGALTASTMGLYVFIVGYLGGLLQGRDRSVIAFLAAGLVAVLFQPLRERLQRGVNHLMYGERDDPYAVLSRLGKRLEAAVAPEAGLKTIVETVAQALKLPYVAISLGSADGLGMTASFGLPTSETAMLPLIYQGQEVGQLHCAPRGAGEDFTPEELRLLRNVARQAGAVAHAARLTADLRRSRERLVVARDEERRRLRRDLHDGLGPVLASQGLKIAAVSHLVETDPGRAQRILEELASQNEAAVGEIRRLVYALRPLELDELGLVAAIADYAAGLNVGKGEGTEFKVHVDAPDEELLQLSAAVEVAAYRIATEGLTNVTRHAKARHCTISLSLEDGLHGRALRMEILDDGVGFSDRRGVGVGLSSMSERAQEVGGELRVESAVSQGTRVISCFPLSGL